MPFFPNGCFQNSIEQNLSFDQISSNIEEEPGDIFARDFSYISSLMNVLDPICKQTSDLWCSLGSGSFPENTNFVCFSERTAIMNLYLKPKPLRRVTPK